MREMNSLTDLENLALDFLQYRKQKRYQMQSTLPFLQDGWTGEAVSPEPAAPVWNDTDCMDYYHNLYSDVCRRLKPLVQEAVMDFSYEGGPGLGREACREQVAQMVDYILAQGKREIGEIEEICGETRPSGWSRHRLLRALTEAMVVFELMRTNF